MKTIELKYSVGDRVRHKIHQHLHGFVNEIVIGNKDSVRYLVEVCVEGELGMVSFFDHELDEVGENNPIAVGFTDGSN